MFDSKFQGTETHMGSGYKRAQARIRFRVPRSLKHSTDVCAKISNSLGIHFNMLKTS